MARKKIDYTSFRTDGTYPNDSQFERKWWKLDKKERPQAIAQIVRFLAEYDSKRATQYQISTRLYGNTDLMGLNGLSYSKIVSVQPAMKDRISYNVVQSAIDTLAAKMAKNKPRPLFLTSGGDYKLQRKAKKLDKFVDGIFYQNHAYKMGIQTFLDGCIFGDGLTHVYSHNGRICHERILPSELYTDWVEAFYGHPLQLHRVKTIDRDVLIESYPRFKAEILDAPSSSQDLLGSYQNIADQVTVAESWRLPSSPDSGDGMHTISLPNQELMGEEYKKSYYPFARFQFNKRRYGYWGQSAAEQIQNIQLELNKMLWVEQRTYHLAGTFKVLLENGSKIVKEHLNNDIGAIVNYSGTKPEYVVPPLLPAGFQERKEFLIKSAYEVLGISQLSANSQKPSGLNSGRALREYNDIESDRFTTVGQSYEDYFLELARLDIDEAKDIYKKEGKFEIKVPGKKFIETIDWGDIDLEEDEYVMKMFPVSSLPQEPAGRLQTIQEYIQAGFISPRTGRRLLDFPDLEQIETLANAEEEYLHDILEKIVEEGEFTSPEPYDDLNLAKELALEYYAQGKCQGMEEDKLDMLRRFMSQIDLELQKAQPPPMPQVTPQAAPQPQPTSELVPNVPGAA